MWRRKIRRRCGCQAKAQIRASKKACPSLFSLPPSFLSILASPPDYEASAKLISLCASGLCTADPAAPAAPAAPLAPPPPAAAAASTPGLCLRYSGGTTTSSISSSSILSSPLSRCSAGLNMASRDSFCKLCRVLSAPSPPFSPSPSPSHHPDKRGQRRRQSKANAC